MLGLCPNSHPEGQGCPDTVTMTARIGEGKGAVSVDVPVPRLAE